MTNYKNCLVLSVAVITLLLISGTSRGAELKGRVALPAGATPAVVFLQGVAGDTLPDLDTVITHLDGGAFEPAVSIGFVGNEFVFKNEDDRLHTTHLYLHLAYQEKVSGRPLKNGATLYNIALPLLGMEVHRPIKAYHEFTAETGFIAVRCNPHRREEAAVLVFDHPYAAVSGADGSFSIPNVPAGTHDVWVYHDGVASMWRSVAVSGSGPTEITVEVSAQ